MTAIYERDADLAAGILDHCDRILAFLGRIDSSKECYDEDELFKDAIKMNLFQIGELANRLSEDFKEKTDDIPWHQIYGARNIIAHGYIKVDDSIIWETCVTDIPSLKKRLEEILEN